MISIIRSFYCILSALSSQHKNQAFYFYLLKHTGLVPPCTNKTRPKYPRGRCALSRLLLSSGRACLLSFFSYKKSLGGFFFPSLLVCVSDDSPPRAKTISHIVACGSLRCGPKRRKRYNKNCIIPYLLRMRAFLHVVFQSSDFLS